MQRGEDSCSSSFSSTDLDAQMVRDSEAAEANLASKYGRMNIKQRALIGKARRNERRYFDSADYSMQKEGKLAADIFLGFDCPIDQLPVKSEPTVPTQRSRSHLDQVGWAEPAALPIATTRTVIDI